MAAVLCHLLALRTRDSAAGAMLSLRPQMGSPPELPELESPLRPGTLPSRGRPASSGRQPWERQETRPLCRVTQVGSFLGGPPRDWLEPCHSCERRKDQAFITGAGPALTAGPRYSPVGHKQLHRIKSNKMMQALSRVSLKHKDGHCATQTVTDFPVTPSWPE